MTVVETPRGTIETFVTRFQLPSLVKGVNYRSAPSPRLHINIRLPIQNIFLQQDPTNPYIHALTRGAPFSQGEHGNLPLQTK